MGKKGGVNSDMRKPSGLSGTKAMEFNATKRNNLSGGGVNKMPRGGVVSDGDNDPKGSVNDDMKK
jgi:hypothetical protein